MSAADIDLVSVGILEDNPSWAASGCACHIPLDDAYVNQAHSCETRHRFKTQTHMNHLCSSLQSVCMWAHVFDVNVFQNCCKFWIFCASRHHYSANVNVTGAG